MDSARTSPSAPPDNPPSPLVRLRYIPPTGHDAGGPELAADISKILTERQCLACQQVDTTSIGPRYIDVALRYRGDSEAARILPAILGLAEGLSEIRGSASGRITSPPAPESAESGVAWEITAEAPGFAPARVRIPAS